MIKVGATLPAMSVFIPGTDGPEQVNTSDLFKGKRAVVFTVPGAFTPTCSAKHLPGYIEKADALRDKGIEMVGCLSVNDAFVMTAWGQKSGAQGAVTMIADGNGDLVSALGLDVDQSARGMGVRAQRVAIVLDNCVVTHMFVEPKGSFGVSSAENVLANI